MIISRSIHVVSNCIFSLFFMAEQYSYVLYLLYLFHYWWTFRLFPCPTLCDPVDCSVPGSSACGDSPGKDTGVGCHALPVSCNYNQITVTQKPGSGRGQSPHVSKESTRYRASDLQQSRRPLWHLNVANALHFACSSLSAPVLVLLLFSTARHRAWLKMSQL